MKIQCPICNKAKNIPDEYLGKEVKCDFCNKFFLAKKSKKNSPPAKPKPTQHPLGYAPLKTVLWPYLLGILAFVVFLISSDEIDASGLLTGIGLVLCLILFVLCDILNALRKIINILSSNRPS